MALKFKCGKCQQDILVQFLKIGEVASVQTHLEGVLSDLLEKQSDTFATRRELLDRWGYEMVNPHAFRRIRTGK